MTVIAGKIGLHHADDKNKTNDIVERNITKEND